MQFSLKDLLAIVAFAACFAWIIQLAGVESHWLWRTLAACGAMSTAFVALASFKRTRRFAFFPGLFGVIGLSSSSLTTVFFGALLFGCGIACAWGGVRRTMTLSYLAMSCSVVALLTGTADVASRVWAMWKVRAEFAVESIEPRLEYESRIHRGHERESVTLGSEVEARLVGREHEVDEVVGRQGMLKWLHSREYERFVRADGFGIERMPYLFAEDLRVPPPRDIEFNDSLNSRINRNRISGRFIMLPPSEEAEGLHTASYSDFLNFNTFGASFGEKLKVAGFAPHAWRHPIVDRWEDAAAWTIDRLELVSLLKFDEPRVYVLDHLPRMDQLSAEGVPTRELDGFETDALKRLWRDEDVVIAHDEDDYQMLGSLRAARQCLDCHSVNRGDLLGAFSYKLRRQPISPTNDAQIAP